MNGKKKEWEKIPQSENLIQMRYLLIQVSNTFETSYELPGSLILLDFHQVIYLMLEMLKY